MDEIKLVTIPGKERFMISLKQASIQFTNPENTLQVLYEKEDDHWLCIIKKFGTKTNKTEAIKLNFDEYKAGFKKCVNGHWFFQTFQNKHIITWR